MFQVVDGITLTPLYVNFDDFSNKKCSYTWTKTSREDNFYCAFTATADECAKKFRTTQKHMTFLQ